MSNLGLSFHVKLRNNLLKKQIRISDKIRAVRSNIKPNDSFLVEEVVKIELASAETEIRNIQRDIDAQQEIIDDYMNNLIN